MNCARAFPALGLCPAWPGLCADSLLCDVAEGSDVSSFSAPALEGEPEGPPSAELQKEVEGCHLVPSGPGGPKIHSRRFRE